MIKWQQAADTSVETLAGVAMAIDNLVRNYNSREYMAALMAMAQRCSVQKNTSSFAFSNFTF